LFLSRTECRRRGRESAADDPASEGSRRNLRALQCVSVLISRFDAVTVAIGREAHP
jgi:hypothetical protein